MSQLTDLINANKPTIVGPLIEAQPDFRVFNLLWSSPEEIVPACEAMGWQTLDDLGKWIINVNAAIGNTQAFVDLIDPPVDIKPPRSVPFAQIHAAIAAQVKLSDDLQINQSDASYMTPTKAQWQTLAKTCPIKRRKHSGTEQMDCDDYTKAFLGWLAFKGLGNCAAGFAATRHYRDQTLTGGHALVICVDAEGIVWFIEPQTGNLHTPAEAVNLGGNWLANRMEVARVYF